MQLALVILQFDDCSQYVSPIGRFGPANDNPAQRFSSSSRVMRLSSRPHRRGRDQAQATVKDRCRCTGENVACSTAGRAASSQVGRTPAAVPTTDRERLVGASAGHGSSQADPEMAAYRSAQQRLHAPHGCA